ncbi:MAG: DUF1499 domain-containing protein [Rhodothermales bacterium]|nr:DUF1499 domain-containing protein [Rhodothermales bacterium]
MPNTHPFPCPPNRACAHATHRSPADVETVFHAAREALVAMNASGMTVDAARSRVEATFRVMVFLDDLRLEVHPGANGAGARLYVQSRSRVGRFDFGVNRRRVNRLLRRIGAVLPPSAW